MSTLADPDAVRLRRIEDEADSALNLARMLRAQLRELTAPPPPAAAASVEKKERLHRRLDWIQGLTPASLRALVRPLYLRLIYRRLFPEFSGRQPLERIPLDNALTAWSGVPEFIEYKQRVCRTLPMDYRSFGAESIRGLVSVVLPVYNGERYLAQSIESVLAQTYANLELIAVDDGSTDGTPAILERFAGEPRVRIVRQPNRKLPGALNAGFGEARGEFFTWTSADNLMRPEMLAELTAFLTGNPDAEMVYADEELIDGAGAPAVNRSFCRIYQWPFGSHLLRRPFDPGELNFVQNNYIGGCFLYRAWAARAVGGYSAGCFGFEDYDYWLRMNSLFRVAHLGKRQVLYSYRLHEDSLSAREAELLTAERARYFLPVDQERRRFFAASFDVTLAGDHPWFRPLARLYRAAGHNVFEMADSSAETLYLHRVTRAFPKSITISCAPGRAGDFAVLDGDRLRAGGYEWTAGRAEDAAYPLLAIANARSWELQSECPRHASA